MSHYFTNKSDIGNYSYSGTDKANPHAATSVGGTTYTYDNNGNLTDDGTRTYTWNYNNTLASLTTGGNTYQYGYDHGKQRTSVFDGTATTTYPNQYYNTDGTTTTKHIYADDELVATLETVGTSTPTVRYIHTDHLGGTHVVTNASSTEAQAIDYYPFGGIRINSKTDASDEQRKFTGYEYDEHANIHYAGARYYSQDIGKFLGIDPVVKDIITDPRGSIVLQDPQLANSYSYARNNPIIYRDDNGEFIILAPLVIYAPQILAAGITLTSSAFLSSMLADDIATLNDPNASGGEKALIVGASVFGPAAKSTKEVAKQITNNSHTFYKHVLDKREFAELDIRTKDQFQTHLENVLENPSRSGDLRNGRSYAYDKDTNTIVIQDPNTPDGGTAFRPEEGEAFIDKRLK